MKNLKNKMKYVSAMAFMGAVTITNVAAKTPTFSDTEAQKAANGFLGPLTKTLLWLLPLAASIAALAGALIWLCKSDEEKEQKPYIQKTLKPILITTLVAESIDILFLIFGI